ncbi:MAG: hypothetical protein H6815_13055 [Phycisphaeraceae bacterium]|nr:hypothetical protein [Phycisphaerales bacterium]MCB9861370.1 hypothetical protein [Phycisphaeraceae bacterium]
MICAHKSLVNSASFRCLRAAALFACLSALVGCQTHNVAGTAIVSEPSGAAISVNNAIIGLSPVLHEFDFSLGRSQTITASVPGYFDTVMKVTSSTPDINHGKIKLILHADSAYSRTVESDAANHWITVPVDPRYTSDDAWRRVVDAVSGRYTGIETMDKESGYIRSSSAIETFQHPQFGPYRVRTRVVTALSQAHPPMYKVKLVAETDGGRDQWAPYDRVFTEDAAFIEELLIRLSEKQ